MAEIYSEKELFSELRDAYISNKKVMVLGYGRHSEIRKADIYLQIKMDEYEIKDNCVIASAGASVSKIREEALDKGLLFPSFYDGTIGGLLANNEISPLSTRFGKPSDFTEWVNFMTSFKMFRWKGIIGSKGTFGAITKAKIRLFNRPNKVYTFESKIEDSSLLVSNVNKFLKMNPLVLLVEYTEKEKYQFHATLTEDLDLAGFTKDEGVPNIEESNKNSYYLKTQGIEDFVRIVERINPIYAYTILNTGYTKVYVADEDLLSNYSYLKSEEAFPIYKKLKKIFDFKGIFA
ncbi:FAD-binding protein [Acidianus sulfidivorans]|uniref:FAD-binding protein n=1 Tax=Acidianus sulfidivorans TaxID=312539 RepID=UPI0013A59AF5|nr:FAD-binding protein [Acidianus sulfidivorans]